MVWLPGGCRDRSAAVSLSGSRDGKWCNDGRISRLCSSGNGQALAHVGYAMIDDGEIPGLMELASDISEGASDICEVVGDGLHWW